MHTRLVMAGNQRAPGAVLKPRQKGPVCDGPGFSPLRQDRGRRVLRTVSQNSPQDYALIDHSSNCLLWHLGRSAPAPVPAPLPRLRSVFPTLARWAPCPWILASGFASGGTQTGTLSSLFPPWDLRSLVSAKLLGTAFQAPHPQAIPSPIDLSPSSAYTVLASQARSSLLSCLPSAESPEDWSGPGSGWPRPSVDHGLNLDPNVFLGFLSYLFLNWKDY